MRDRAARHSVMLAFAFLFTALAAPSSFGVGAPLPLYRLGFHAGLNSANMGGGIDDYGIELARELEDQFGGRWTADRGAITGAGIVVAYVVPVGPIWALQLEGQYVRRGAGFEVSGREISDLSFPGSVDFTTRFVLDYLEFPILLRCSPAPGSPVRPVFLAGLVPGVRVGADLEVEVEGFTAAEDASDLFKGASFGFTAALGIDARLSESAHLVAQARYLRGLVNQLDSPTLTSESQDVAFMVGLEFPLAKRGARVPDRRRTEGSPY